MVKNRVVYSVLIVALALLSFMSGGGAAYNVLLGALFIPIISFILTAAIYFPAMNKLSFYGKLSVESLLKGEKGEYKFLINNDGRIPLLCAKIALRTNNPGLKVSKREIFFRLPPNGEAELILSLIGIYRGTYTIEANELVIYGPFCLFGLKKKLNIKESLTVLPSINIQDYISVINSIRNNGGTDTYIPNQYAEDLSEIAGLRRYRQGDNLKRIHWQATARKGELISKEYEFAENRKAMFILDNSIIENVNRNDSTSRIEDLLMEILSSALFIAADGKTDVTLKYIENEKEAGIISQDFEVLYAKTAKINFDSKASFLSVLDRLQYEIAACDDTYIFTVSSDKELTEKMEELKNEHSRLTLITVKDFKRSLSELRA